MSTDTCAHPNCDKALTRGQSVCARHWHQLPNVYQLQLRQAKTVEARGATRLDVVEYFQSRMIGDLEIVTCRGPNCGKDIVWMTGFRKSDGSQYKVPVDVDSIRETDVDFNRNRHQVHWETCPDADDFRKGRR